MLIADLFLPYRKSFRVAIFALLLVTPSQSSKAPNGCSKVTSALAKNQILDVLVKEPNFLPNAMKCLQETIKLIGKSNWKTVKAMMPPKITNFIHDVGQHVMRNAKEYTTGTGLIFMSVYLCYKGTELSIEAKHLALEHVRFQEKFDLLQQELIQIECFIDTEVVPQWKTGNTAQLVKNIEKPIKKLHRSSAILKELVDQIHYNTKECESGKKWCVFYGVLATGACVCAIGTGNLWVYATVCGFSIGTIFFSCDTHTTNNKTLERSARLRKDANDWQKKIQNYIYNLEMY